MRGVSTTQDRLDALRTALKAHADAGGVVRVREADGREVQYDLAWAVEEEARLARLVEAEKGNRTGGGILQPIRYRRMR